MAQHWWVADTGLNILPGNAAYGGSGNLGRLANSGAVQFRSNIDRDRAVGGRIPQAEYPDGYLGNMPWDRRRDRLAINVTERLTARSYQRGVHKGSRIPPKDYFWPSGEPQPMDGLKREARAVRSGNVLMVPRFAPTGNPVERISHMGKTAGMATPEETGLQLQRMRSMDVDPARNPVIPQDPDHIRAMIPRYATGRR